LNKVTVTVSGPVGSGKSAICGEIEILCKALGLQVDWVNGREEKNLTHADWTDALEMYKPSVEIVEAYQDATSKAVKQLADWLLTEPNDGNPLCFAGAPERTFLGLSRVKMRSIAGDDWTLIAGLHEGWQTAEERATNFARIAKLEAEEVRREEQASKK
jgi:hypothetical protein